MCCCCRSTGRWSGMRIGRYKARPPRFPHSWGEDGVLAALVRYGSLRRGGRCPCRFAACRPRLGRPGARAAPAALHLTLFRGMWARSLRSHVTGRFEVEGSARAPSARAACTSGGPARWLRRLTFALLPHLWNPACCRIPSQPSASVVPFVRVQPSPPRFGFRIPGGERGIDCRKTATAPPGPE